MKKRHRQMAGKGLKDVTALNKCSSCGHVKRAHLLCPYCVSGRPLVHSGNCVYTDHLTEVQGMFKGKAEKTTSDKPVDQ